jgi:uncharacterized protein
VSTPGVAPWTSALYEGTLWHRRSGPGPANECAYRVALPLLDLAEVDEVMARHPLWSAHRPAPVWFRRADFLGDPQVPLDEEVRRLVAERTAQRPAGPVALLGHLRTWGWLFNPISLYFCAEAPGGPVAHLVCEVENTPWHERHPYVVGPPGRHDVRKSLHVSPFLPEDLTYEITYTPPLEHFDLRIDVTRGATTLLEATLSLHRTALDRHAMGRLLWAYPAMATRVSAGIYRQALRLRRRGAPVFPHPPATVEGVAR